MTTTKPAPGADEGAKKCARCGDAEFRIDGYCSVYCCDMAETEEERDDLRTQLAAANERAEKLQKERDEAIVRVEKAEAFARDSDPGKWGRMKVAENDHDALHEVLKGVRKKAAEIIAKTEEERDQLRARLDRALEALKCVPQPDCSPGDWDLEVPGFADWWNGHRAAALAASEKDESTTAGRSTSPTGGE